MRTHSTHKITPRAVSLDLSKSQIHWLEGDAFSSHVFNGIHLLLPEGEFWFCRVYNKALPYIKDEKLKEDVQAFIRQEAIHARAHITAQDYLRQHDYDIEQGLELSKKLFGTLLSDKPFGKIDLKFKALEEYWLIMRVGFIAAIEHFTGVIGQWALDSEETWQANNANPEMSDLFLWHLAEEVEHRNVAFDLFHHLLQNKVGFYISRQAIMVAVFPIFLYLLAQVAQSLIRQDSDVEMQKLAKASFVRLLVELEKVGRSKQNIPTFTHLFKSVVRWTSPKYHPEEEGNTEQALEYFERSMAVAAAKNKKTKVMANT